MTEIYLPRMFFCQAASQIGLKLRIPKKTTKFLRYRLKLNPAGLDLEGDEVISGLLSSPSFRPHPLISNYPISPISVSLLESNENEFAFGLQSQMAPQSHCLEDSLNKVVVCGTKAPTSVTSQPPVFQPIASGLDFKNSSATVIISEEFRKPLKAAARTGKRKSRKLGRSFIATDTPDKLEIANVKKCFKRKKDIKITRKKITRQVL